MHWCLMHAVLLFQKKEENPRNEQVSMFQKLFFSFVTDEEAKSDRIWVPGPSAQRHSVIVFIAMATGDR